MGLHRHPKSDREPMSGPVRRGDDASGVPDPTSHDEPPGRTWWKNTSTEDETGINRDCRCLSLPCGEYLVMHGTGQTLCRTRVVCLGSLFSLLHVMKLYLLTQDCR